MSEYLARLHKIRDRDPEQWDALRSSSSRVVLAGPGAGKTYLLTGLWQINH